MIKKICMIALAAIICTGCSAKGEQGTVTTTPFTTADDGFVVEDAFLTTVATTTTTTVSTTTTPKLTTTSKASTKTPTTAKSTTVTTTPTPTTTTKKVTTTTKKITTTTTTTTKKPIETAPDGFALYKDVGKEYYVFDSSRIVDVYRNGTETALSDMENAILEKARGILDEIKTTCETDYDIELAVYDYILLNSTYDKGAISPLGIAGKNAHNPYGILFDGQGICLGYTTTFKMFMEMAGIPCMVVYAYGKDSEHSWNEVKIGGKWYYVDPTWDDPAPETEKRLPMHKYFNVSQEILEDTDHKANWSLYYEADSLDASFYVNNFYEQEKIEESLFDIENGTHEDFVIRHKDEDWDYEKVFKKLGKNVIKRYTVEYDGYFYTNFRFDKKTAKD